jgi:hypothetical protein
MVESVGRTTTSVSNAGNATTSPMFLARKGGIARFCCRINTRIIKMQSTPCSRSMPSQFLLSSMFEMKTCMKELEAIER